MEILSESDIPQPGKLLDESSKLLLSTESFPTEVQVIGSPGTEVFLDYVTLKKELPPLCLGVNFYLYDPEKGSPDTPQSCVCFFPDGSSYVSLCAENDFLNDSYLPMVEPQDSTEDGQFPGNSYTNVFYT